MPPQNPQANSGGRFSRYQSEQVQQIPAGYVEGMSSWGRMAQNLGTSIAGMMAQTRAEEQQAKTNTLKTNENAIAGRKADAADRANNLKEQSITNDALLKSWGEVREGEKDVYGRVKDAVTAQGGIVVGLEGIIASTDPEVTAEMKQTAKLQLANARTEHQTLTKKMIGMAAKPPMTFDEFQAKQLAAWTAARKASETPKPPATPPAPKTPAEAAKDEAPYDPIGDPTPTKKVSYYNSPAYNPTSTTGMEPDVTKTVAFGGSSKKVVVAGGRVVSVVSPNGKTTPIRGNVSEALLPEINEVVSSYASNDNIEEAEASAQAAPAVEETVDLPGPLKGTSYRHSEPIPAGVDSVDKKPLNGTIEFETTTDSTGKETSIPRIKFYSKGLQNADGTENVEEHQRLRQLTLINEVLRDGSYKDIEIDSDERFQAAQELGTDGNKFDMPAIAKAWALVQRNIKGGHNDNEANLFSLRFENTHNVSPSEFMATGEASKARRITASATVAMEETLNDRVAKRLQEVGQQPGKPEGLTEAVKKNDDDIKFLEARIKELTKSLGNPMVIGTKEETGYKNKKAGFMSQLEVAKAEGAAINNKINAWEAQNRQYQQRSDAVAKEVAIDLSMQQLQAGRTTRTEIIAEKKKRWIGINKDDNEIANGFVAKGLSSLPEHDRQIPIKINGKLTGRYYDDRLDPIELFKVMSANRDSEGITELTALMPEVVKHIDDPKHGITATQKKYIEGVIPLQELSRLNDQYVDLFSKNGRISAEMKLNWEKLWHDNTGTSTATTFQKTLVGKIREAIVGPGNPSNYEQEVIASIVPNPADFLSRPLRQRARIQALAMLSMFDHYNNMSANKLQPTEELMRNYTHQLGQVLGYKVTKATFSALFNDYVKSKDYFNTQRATGNNEPKFGKEYAARLLDSLEERAIAEEGTKAKSK